MRTLEHINGVVTAAIREHGDELNLKALDNDQAVDLGMILHTGALRVLRAHAKSRENGSEDKAQAIRTQMQQQIVDHCGLDFQAAETLVLSVTNAIEHFRPNLETLRHDLLGDGPVRQRRRL